MTEPSSRICQTCGASVAQGLPCLACSLKGVLEELSSDRNETPASGEAKRFSPIALPSHFGHYRVEREIAAGGMGMVYEAHDTRLNRRVALKMLRQVLFATDRERVRFQSEAELVSQMDHPNIVPIHDVGKIHGQPYFTMKFILGGSLAERLTAGAFPPKAAAALMVKVARAVHHAHLHGVLHCDLKPANILLDDCDEPLLTDFGLAKLLHTDSDKSLTQSLIGTPDYMAPEQVSGQRRSISTATDVWALGVILYQLTTGQPPFQGEGHADVLRQVAESDPPRLGVDTDIDTLCQRCLEKDPARRLGSAGELADELERWQNGEPIHSRRITPLQRLGKWMRRHPYRTALISAFALLLLGSTAAVTWQWRAAERSAEAERQTAYAAILGQALTTREYHDFGQARRLLDSIDPERRGFDWRLLHGLCRGDETLSFRLGEGYESEPQCLARIPGEEHLAILSADGRLHLRNLEGEEIAPPRALPPLPQDGTQQQRYRALTYSPNGKRLAYANGDVLHVLEVSSLALICEETSRLPQFAWLDEDRLLYGFNGSVTAPPYPEAGAWILHLKDVHSVDQEIPRTSFPQMCAPLAVSPDRRSFVLHRVDTKQASWPRTLHVYRDSQDFGKIPEPIYSLPDHEYPRDLAFSLQGNYLALTAGAQIGKSARVLAVATGDVLFDHEFRFPLHGLAIDPQERRLGLVSDDGVVRLYDFTRGNPMDALANTYDDDVKLSHRQENGARGAHNPPRDLITRSAQDGRAQFFLGHESRVFDLLFDSDGLLVTASGDGTIRRWPKDVTRPALPIGNLVTSYKRAHPAASLDGRHVLFNIDRGAYRGDVSNAAVGWISNDHAPLAVLADGRAITQDRGSTDIVLWDGMQEEQRLTSLSGHPTHWGQTRRGSLSEDEKRLAGVMDGWLFTADLESDTVAWSGALGATTSAFASHDISPDGQWVASSDFGPRVSIHPFADPSEIVTYLEGKARDQDTAVAFSRDGLLLYTGNADGRVRVWDTARWEEIPERSWPAHRGAVTALALSHDGTLMATSGDDTLKLFPIGPKPGDRQRREHLSFHLDQPANWIHFARGEDGRDRALLHSAPGRRLEIWEADSLLRKPAPKADLLPRALAHHRMTQLPSGKVLVAGGEELTGNGQMMALSSCYLYDPASKEWSVTGSMHHPRSRFPGLTRLRNGTVLAASGSGREQLFTEACEIYEPESGTWRVTGSMIIARTDHLLTLLPDGQVLVAGGRDANFDPIASCELYDPDTGTWRLTTSLPTARFGLAGTLLSDGTVLAVGGHDGNSPLTTCDLYDPRTETWQPTAPLSEPRDYFSATALANGGALAISGRSSKQGPLASCERYDPITQTWSRTGSLPRVPGYPYAAILLPTGKVFYLGEFANGEGPISAGTLLYTPSTGSWGPGPVLQHPVAARTTALLDNGKILITGGNTPQHAYRSVEIMAP